MEELLDSAVGLAVVLSPVIGIVIQLIKQTAVDNRWLPHLSILAGVLVSLVFGYATGADLFLYGVAGFLSGAGASGLYDALANSKGVK